MTNTKLPVKIAKNIKLCSDITMWARDFGLYDEDCMSASDACEMLEQAVEHFDAKARAERKAVEGFVRLLLYPQELENTHPDMKSFNQLINSRYQVYSQSL